MHIKRRYRLSKSDYAELLAKQQGCCALCDRELSKMKRVVVDHDHENARVRGLLCDRCNLRLKAIEKPGFVRAALEYLAKEQDGPLGTNSRRRKAAAPALIARQGGTCAICPRPVERTVRGYGAVDHDHVSKRIRAVLCWECNVNLAAIEHREFLARATAYVAA